METHIFSSGNTEFFSEFFINRRELHWSRCLQKLNNGVEDYYTVMKYINHIHFIRRFRSDKHFFSQLESSWLIMHFHLIKALILMLICLPKNSEKNNKVHRKYDNACVKKNVSLFHTWNIVSSPAVFKSSSFPMILCSCIC